MTVAQEKLHMLATIRNRVAGKTTFYNLVALARLRLRPTLLLARTMDTQHRSHWGSEGWGTIPSVTKILLYIWITKLFS